MSAKDKGTKAERDLISMLWGAGWGAIRSAGSGSMHFPSPDILAGNKVRRVAIEAKATGEPRKYLTQGDVDELVSFSEYFGAEPWFAVKFDRKPWVFVHAQDLKKTRENYAVGPEMVGALSFDDFLGR